MKNEDEYYRINNVVIPRKYLNIKLGYIFFPIYLTARPQSCSQPANHNTYEIKSYPTENEVETIKKDIKVKDS
jgi:hypothetical protein